MGGEEKWEKSGKSWKIVNYTLYKNGKLLRGLHDKSRKKVELGASCI
jgi:hypothetical protein